MKIIDISWPLSQKSTTYKDKKSIQFSLINTVEKDGVQESSLTLSSHTGTHVDAPAHFLADGKNIDKIPLDQLIGPCKVFDLTKITNVITAEHLHDFDLEEDDIVLFKTSNSLLAATAPFKKDFVYLDFSAAHYLVDCGISAIGFDYLGIERDQPAHDTHKILMDADIAIIEGLRLSHVKQDSYLFVCLPLAVQELEAAPARAILVTEI